MKTQSTSTNFGLLVKVLLIFIVYSLLDVNGVYAQNKRNPNKTCLKGSTNIQRVKMKVNIHFILTKDGCYGPLENQT